MGVLTDYLEIETLQQLQNAFAAVMCLPIRFCDPQGKALTEASIGCSPTGKSSPVSERARTAVRVGKMSRYDVPIRMGDEVVGRIVLESSDPAMDLTGAAPGAPATRLLRLLGLMAGMISRLCDRESQLRTRMEELAALYRLTGEFTAQRDLQGVLDTVAATVVDVLKAKSCSIRLLSEDRKELLIKAVANMSPEYLSKGPILVSRSVIDSEVLSTGKCLYIADERDDPRVLYPAEARREGIVSALVAPLIYKGRAEGVIRVYAGSSYKFDWFETSLLTAIAGEAAVAIVNSRLNEEAVHLANMRRALTMAGDVQRRMIPAGPPKIDGFEIAALYVPSYELGGDFYDFIPLGAGNMGFVICDVVGKGVRASLLMASIRASLRAHASSIYNMSEVMARVNRDLCEDVLTSDFATLFYGVLDSRDRRFTYCNAGHPPPLLLREGEQRSMSAGGLVIGIDPDAEYKVDSVLLNRGDMVMAYTDGIFEAMNFDDEPFGMDRLAKAARWALDQKQSAEAILRHALWEMRRFAGLQTRFDDLTLLAIKVL